MLSLIKKGFKKIAAFGAALWPAFKTFIKWPIFAIGIATIPITMFIERKFKIGPITSRIIGALVLAGLMIISWHFAEIIIVLVAIAYVMEVFLLYRLIKARIKQHKNIQILEAEYTVVS